MAKQARNRAVRKKRAETVDDSFPLVEEVRTYESHLPGWLGREGQFVLIKGRQVLGFLPMYELALAAGYRQLGNVDFLVKQIARFEPIYNLGNVDL